MTLAPHRPPRPFVGLEDVAGALRERGGRLSAARRLVLESLFAAEGPVSAEWIADGLGGERTQLDVSSVYRSLERLEELGVVAHVHVGHGPGLYALEGERQREYFVCERCSRVDTVEAGWLDEVRSNIRTTFGYEVRFSHFPLVGLCSGCAAVRESGPPASRHRTRGAPRRAEDHRHDHEHEHEHEHSHGDRVHSHPHTHERGLEEEHEHAHVGSP